MVHMATTLFNRIDALIAQLRSDGGFSASAQGVTPATGYMVSRQGHTLKFPASWRDSATSVLFSTYLLQNAAPLLQGAYFGGWVNEEGGHNYIYLDLSDCVPTLDEALTLAAERGELAVYDVVNQTSINVTSPA